MKEKYLGMIEWAEFGTVNGYPFLFGLQLRFKFDGSQHIYNGSLHTVNISKNCSWKQNREQVITKLVEDIHDILKEAKVNYVSELIGKPVEITLENDRFSDFRILTEVL